MAKQTWKPGNMLYPLPAVMVSVGDKEGNTNILTIAWTGTVCTNPPIVYISVRPERQSYHMIEESGDFVINLTTEELARAADYCGVRSGRDVDKWKECALTQRKAETLKYAPVVAESPVNIECRVVRKEELGSHHMFLAEVTAVQVDDVYLDEKGRFDLNRTGLVAYSHGEYLSLGEKLGNFGYSVRKKSSPSAGSGKKEKTVRSGKKEQTARPGKKEQDVQKRKNSRRQNAREAVRQPAEQNEKSSRRLQNGKKKYSRQAAPAQRGKIEDRKINKHK